MLKNERNENINFLFKISAAVLSYQQRIDTSAGEQVDKNYRWRRRREILTKKQRRRRRDLDGAHLYTFLFSSSVMHFDSYLP